MYPQLWVVALDWRAVLLFAPRMAKRTHGCEAVASSELACQWARSRYKRSIGYARLASVFRRESNEPQQRVVDCRASTPYSFGRADRF